MQEQLDERKAALAGAEKRLQAEIAERKQLEKRLVELGKAAEEAGAQLAESARSAASGELAAAIAGKINPPLESISGILGMIKKRYQKNTSLFPGLDLTVLLRLEGAVDSIRHTAKSLTKM